MFCAPYLVIRLNSHISWEYRLMIFSGPWHVHVYICITICLFIVPHQFLKVDLLRLPLRAGTTPHPSLHPLFSACAHNLDCCKGWYSRCMRLCLTTGDQIMSFLFTSEATLICYVIPVFLIVVNSYIDWEYRLVIVKGKYFLAYTLCWNWILNFIYKWAEMHGNIGVWSRKNLFMRVSIGATSHILGGEQKKMLWTA